MNQLFTARNRRRERVFRKMAAMRAAKERKRLAAGPREEEPKMILVRHPHLSWAMRDDLSGDVVWMPFVSVRDIARRVSMVTRHYQPAALPNRRSAS